MVAIEVIEKFARFGYTTHGCVGRKVNKKVADPSEFYSFFNFHKDVSLFNNPNVKSSSQNMISPYSTYFFREIPEVFYFFP
jgi:hypothetical protein